MRELSERLGREVEVQTGTTFEIFNDRTIRWGELWRDRIEHAIDTATFLIPFVTPSFLTSKECRREFEQFVQRERTLGSTHLIFPIMYVDVEAVTSAASRTRDPVVLEIRKRQFVSLEDLRFEPLTSATVGFRLKEFAGMIREALKTQGQLARRGRSFSPPQATAADPSTSSSRTPLQKRSDISPSLGSHGTVEQQTVIVDPLPQRGDYTSVQDAIAHVPPGARIVVRAGLYPGGLVLKTPLEIIGEGAREDVIIEAAGADALVFNTTFGRVANLTLRQIGGGSWYAVDIAQGRLELEDCDISSKSLACVGIHGGADPRLRRNRIRDGNQPGILVYDDARGTIEDNEISGNRFSGIEVLGAADPVLRRNRIHHNGGVCVYVYESARGVFEENDIFGHQSFPGVMIAERGNPVFRRNSIHHNDGVFIHSGGKGLFEDNQIFDAVGSGIGVIEEATPVFRRNRIRNCGHSGVFVYAGGRPLFEDNDICGNAHAGIEIGAAAQATFRGNRVLRNGYEGIWVYSGGGGVFERNHLVDNAMGSWHIDRASQRKVQRDDVEVDSQGR